MYRYPVPFAEHLISHNLFGILVGLICDLFHQVRGEECEHIQWRCRNWNSRTTGEVKGLMVTGCKVEDHEVG